MLALEEVVQIRRREEELAVALLHARKSCRAINELTPRAEGRRTARSGGRGSNDRVALDSRLSDQHAVEPVPVVLLERYRTPLRPTLPPAMYGVRRRSCREIA